MNPLFCEPDSVVRISISYTVSQTSLEIGRLFEFPQRLVDLRLGLRRFVQSEVLLRRLQMGDCLLNRRGRPMVMGAHAQ